MQTVSTASTSISSEGKEDRSLSVISWSPFVKSRYYNSNSSSIMRRSRFAQQQRNTEPCLPQHYGSSSPCSQSKGKPRRFWFFRTAPQYNTLLKHSKRKPSSAQLELLEAWDEVSAISDNNNSVHSHNEGTSSSLDNANLLYFPEPSTATANNSINTAKAQKNSDIDDGQLSSSSSTSSLSSAAELHRQEHELVVLEGHAAPGETVRVLLPNAESLNDLQQYMAKREMTPTQERWNALTMIPGPFFCMYYLLSGLWMDIGMIQKAQQDTQNFGASAIYEQTESDPMRLAHWLNRWMGENDTGCLPNDHWSGLPALPPLPLLAVALGIISHAPFSINYHWTYAHALPSGAARTTHWSRRMDHVMIHFASACISYATSGSFDYFWANLLYNADCMYRQFKHKVRPRRNKIRVLISILAYTLPILRRGHLVTFLQFWTVTFSGGWLFVSYPIGGWSHAAFHLMYALLPPILMTAALGLPASQEQMRLAAICVTQHQGGAV